MKADSEFDSAPPRICEESPLKGYRRVLARNHGGRWVLQFVSPEGLRFESQESLASHVCEKRPDIDLSDWEKLDLHFLRHSDGGREIEEGGAGQQLPRPAAHKVQFTFCNMRQNIFDLRFPKKRRKGGQNKSPASRRNSIASWVPQNPPPPAVTSLVAPPPPALPVENVSEPLDTIQDISPGMVTSAICLVFVANIIDLPRGQIKGK